MSMRQRFIASPRCSDGYVLIGVAISGWTKSNVKPTGMRAIFWTEAARGGMCSTSHFFIDAR